MQWRSVGPPHGLECLGRFVNVAHKNMQLKNGSRDAEMRDCIFKPDKTRDASVVQDFAPADPFISALV